MLIESQPTVFVICGPTAAGKSALALSIAEELGGEIVNADSMQVYSGMDIGTAKPSKADFSRINHHLFNIVNPDDEFTASDYGDRARTAIRNITSKGKIPLLVGGTGLYIRSAISGLVDAPGCDQAVRDGYEKLADVFGNEYLHNELEKVDPESAARIHPNNRVRVVRALEVFALTGNPMSILQQEHAFNSSWCNTIKIGVTVGMEELTRRIEQRTKKMIDDGLVDEVQNLLDSGFVPTLKSMSSIGYREVCDYLLGTLSLDEAMAEIKLNTRRYAKRQLTWFRKESDIKWYSDPECINVTTFCRSLVNNS